MNKSWFYPIAIGSLAILATSCGDSKPAATPSATPSPATSPAATAPAATAPVVAPTTPTATVPATTPAPGAPTIPGKKSVSVDVAAGLITSTEGESWAKTVSKGRPDPFATLSLQPVTPPDKIDEFGQVIGKPASASIASNSPTIKSGVNKSLPTIKVASTSPRTTKVSGKRIASKGSTSAEGSITRDGNGSISSIPRTGINRSLPKITVASKSTTASKAPAPAVAKAASNNKIAKNSNVLRPTNIGATPSKTSEGTTIAAVTEKVAAKPLQAMAVEISGVIEVDGRTQVIVKLPNESFSRYIDVGDRVANGTVLVKRVEGQQSLSPTVVLEEVGVEVPRQVGDKATASNAVPQSNPK